MHLQTVWRVAQVTRPLLNSSEKEPNLPGFCPLKLPGGSFFPQFPMPSPETVPGSWQWVVSDMVKNDSEGKAAMVGSSGTTPKGGISNIIG